MKKNMLFVTILLAGIFIVSSCSKGPGEGGKAAIKGKVFVSNYDGTYTNLLAYYYAQEENVYIIYGDDPTYSKSVKTNYDGTYVFPYLRPGKYKVYAYSKDTMKYLYGVPNWSGSVVTNKQVEVLQEIEIMGKKDSVIVPNLDIIK